MANPLTALPELFSKLVVEHGSAVVQEKHIALLKEQFALLEKELSASTLRASELEEENKRLKSDNQNLRQEIQRRDDVSEKVKSHDDLLKSSKTKFGCLVFPGDDKLYCPSCFHKTGKMVETARNGSRNRFCAVCKTTIPSH